MRPQFLPILFLAILASLPLGGQAVGAASTLQPSEIYERWGAAVVTVVGPESVATGFAIPPKGYVVTNYHVVQRQSWLQVILRTGETRQVSSVMLQDPARDLAVLVVSPPMASTVTLGDSAGARVGQRMVVIGSPRGLSQSVTDGLLSQIRTLPDRDVTLLQITAPISPGSSGAPVFNEHGEVLGVVRFFLAQGQNINFAIAINDLRRLLGEQVTPRPQIASSSQPQKELRQRATPPSGVTIYFWNGSRAAARSYQETDDTIVYEQDAGRVVVPRAVVARIIHNADGSVREITRTPPGTPSATAGERKVDVQDLISRPALPSPGSIEPTPSIPARDKAQGACAQDPEDFSKADRQVVTPNVIRLKSGGQWLLVDIRGLQPGDIANPQDARYLDQALSAAHQITLADRRAKAGGRYEATLCVDGQDIADHSLLSRFRVRPLPSR